MSSAAASEPRRPEPRVGWAVVKGLVWTLAPTIVLALALSPFADPNASDGHGSFVFIHSSLWALAADLVFWCVLAAFAAWHIVGTLRSETAAPVSAHLVFGALLVSSLPLFFSYGAHPGPLRVLLLPCGTIWIVRRYAVGSAFQLPLPRRASLVAIAGGVALFVGYVGGHPLVVTGGGGEVPPNGAGRASVGLSNRGFGTLMILSVSGATARAGTAELGTRWGDLPPVRGFRIGARSTGWLTLTHCLANTLTIRYRLYGVTWKQSVPLRRWICSPPVGS